MFTTGSDSYISCGFGKKFMYQTFNIIINYLEYSNKIVIDRGGAVVWIWNPELVKKYDKKELRNI